MKFNVHRAPWIPQFHVFIFFLERYDSTTGIFTVPSGGAGLYYFSTYLGVSVSEYALFDMVVNDENDMFS